MLNVGGVGLALGDGDAVGDGDGVCATAEETSNVPAARIASEARRGERMDRVILECRNWKARPASAGDSSSRVLV